ncbi:hypothetical protein ACFQ5M_05350 [Agrilactobacillus yilanensis]|uniref:DUF106 domain-containing protein n=1 Tax=Agrilactobacillus yilanensis TaxID=2485997 RepID=A0ABW4J771_9LACO|nr:hypothetical protein [Agrilactobacillus yilanensis]
MVKQPQRLEGLFIGGYTFTIFLVAFWAILNYIAHLQVNPLYKHYETLSAFVAALPVSKTEKQTVQAALTAEVAAQVEQKVDEAKATQKVIAQFKTETLQTDNPETFYFDKSYYLLGWGGILIAVGLIALLVKFYLLSWDAPTLTIFIITMVAFGGGLWLTFMLYRILDQFFQGK